MASNVVKGGWTQEEDDKLVHALMMYGARSVIIWKNVHKTHTIPALSFRWSLVSAYVETRNSDRKLTQ